MKKLLFAMSLSLGFTGAAMSQSLSGSIKIKEQSKIEIKMESSNAVNLYAAFRENKYPIMFSFKGLDIPQNSEKKEVVMIQFFTTIKKDGKVVGTIERSPIPFFPGDMFMPVETFDFIPMLSNINNNELGKISEVPKGTYQVTLEAMPIGVKGKINPATFIVFF